MRRAYIDTNGIQLHAVIDGPKKGPLVILLHGFPEHWYSWRYQIPMLATAGFRVIAPDQRGHNLSDKPRRVKDYALETLTQDVVGLIEYAGCEKAIVVGHDWGGAVAYRLAMDYPQRVTKLAIMNSPHPKAFQREIKKISQLLRLRYALYFQIPFLPEAVFRWSPRFWTNLMIQEGAFNKNAFTQFDIETIAEANTQPGAIRSMLNWYRANFRIRPKNGFPKIEVPTLILWGEKDPALKIDLIEGLEPWFNGNLNIQKIPHAGHWVHNEAPEEVNHLLLDFLQ